MAEAAFENHPGKKKEIQNKNPKSKTLFEPLLGGRFVVKRRIRGPDLVEREFPGTPFCRLRSTL